MTSSGGGAPSLLVHSAHHDLWGWVGPQTGELCVMASGWFSIQDSAWTMKSVSKILAVEPALLVRSVRPLAV